MLISHTYKFIFIHVWKTGGNSVSKLLSPFAEDADHSFQPNYLQKLFGRKMPLKPHSNDFEQHIKLPELKERLKPEFFDQYFKFAFVRNPLSLEVSFYHFIRQKNNNHPKIDFIRSLTSFEDYIKWSAENEMIRHSQKPFIFDDRDNMLTDYVGRYEFLQEDFSEVCRRLGLKNMSLDRLNGSEHDSFMKYYNSETELLVRNTLKEDFEAFGYR